MAVPQLEGRHMTDQEKERQIAALLEERRGYENRGLTERVAEVNEMLRNLGVNAEPPAKRSSKRA